MIKKIKITNFKSIENLEFELGKRLNIIIGANGSGKTNILEAIAFGSAASADKLDYEFLGNRIRITSPEFMTNAFKSSKAKEVQLDFFTNNKNFSYSLINDKKDYRSWINQNKEKYKKEVLDFFIELYSNKDFLKNNDVDESLKQFILSTQAFFSKIEDSKKDFNKIAPVFIDKLLEQEFSDEIISDFLIYTPELSYLRKFEEPSQIIPIGIRGEGLFYELKKILSNSKKTSQINDIKNFLHLLDWFEDFDIPNDLMSNEFKISIKDRFIANHSFFDQRSSNEGFLFLLFYLFIFTSKNTPSFFAIDNIETGFNPKLCTNLIKILNELTKKYNKQVIFTTHNPAILDGINLRDNEQRLFIASRDNSGKTNLERLIAKPGSNMKLSELWMKGYIGGVPDNF